MSQLQLNGEIIKKLTDTILAHDPTASDPGICSQYLVGTVGFLLGQQKMEAEQKNDALLQLFTFCQQVVRDVEEHQRSEQAARADNAYGTWKPGN
jgi:hypothetical protein